LELGTWLKGDRNAEALKAYQLGTKAGNDLTAFSMQKGFNALPTDGIEYVGQPKDEERAKRYEAISDFLSSYSYLHPKVPEIDQIVPLPPAKLPPWDGTFQWLKAHEANVPPPLPTEDRIREMAKAKHLDPETGHPLPQKRAEAESAPAQAAAPKRPLGITSVSLQRCPQKGIWEGAAELAVGEKRLVFPQGMTLPTIIVRGPERSLLQKLKGVPPNALAETTWTLVAYAPELGQV